MHLVPLGSLSRVCIFYDNDLQPFFIYFFIFYQPGNFKMQILM